MGPRLSASPNFSVVVNVLPDLARLFIRSLTVMPRYVQYVAVMLQELDVRLEQAILTDLVQVGADGRPFRGNLFHGSCVDVVCDAVGVPLPGRVALSQVDVVLDPTDTPANEKERKNL